MLPLPLFIFGEYDVISVEKTTQGDQIAMEIYAIAVILLLVMILEIVKTFPDDNVKTTAYDDDDFNAGGGIRILKHCWDTLCNFRLKLGYCPEATKSWLGIKEDFKEKSNNIINASGDQITSARRRYWKKII